MSVPVILSQEPFLDFSLGFLKVQPRIRIDLFITNLFLDLVAENIDVAIRFGELEDSSVVATRIGKSIRYVVAAPEYLKAESFLLSLRTSKCNDCVMLNARNNETGLGPSQRSEKGAHPCLGAISSHDFNSVSTFVYRGHGIGLLPSTYCDAAIAELHRRRDEITAEIVRVSAGDIPLLDDTAIKDRFQQFMALARELLTDFREVDHNFRALDRRTASTAPAEFA